MSTQDNVETERRRMIPKNSKGMIANQDLSLLLNMILGGVTTAINWGTYHHSAIDQQNVSGVAEWDILVGIVTRDGIIVITKMKRIDRIDRILKMCVRVKKIMRETRKLHG